MKTLYPIQQQLISSSYLGMRSLNNIQIALYVSKFNVAGNGASGLLFQQLWAMLLLSFYPPSTSSSWSPIVLSNSSEIFPLFAYVIKNVHLDRSNLLTYEVGYDDDDTEDTFGIPESELNIQVRQTNAAEVGCIVQILVYFYLLFCS